jgi:hypothetical protein
MYINILFVLIVLKILQHTVLNIELITGKNTKHIYCLTLSLILSICLKINLSPYVPRPHKLFHENMHFIDLYTDLK